MARKKKDEVAAKGLTRAKFQGFVNVYLNRQEKEQIKSQDWDLATYLTVIEEFCHYGYKFTLSYSETGKFWSASLTGQWQEKPNGGVCMSLKHADMLVAIRALAWCLNEAGHSQDWGERYTQSEMHDW